MSGKAPPRRPQGTPSGREVRRATLRDLEDVLALRAALRREDRPGHREVAEDAGATLLAMTRRQLADPSQLWLIVGPPGDACAVLRCAIVGGDRPYGVLTTAYVVPSARRSGLLRRMVDAASGWAEGLGVRDLRVRANAQNARANEAWAALGFAPSQVILRRVAS